MSDILQATAELLDVNESTLQEFVEEDPFNEGNTIAGYLCRQADHRYGALVILSVNGELTGPQVVHCTPKLKYPFGHTPDGGRAYHWPKVKKILAFDKLDGTNILLYSYKDVDGIRYCTAKTRLTPVLRAGRFGDFVSMWTDMQKKHLQLCWPREVYRGDVALSFEMYGYRNPIAVKYDTPLATNMLFSVSQDGRASVTPPHEYGEHLVPLQPEATLTDPTKLTEFYNELRDKAHAKNGGKTEPGEFVSEGYVLYCQLEDDTWEMFKAKPEEVEDMAWSACASVPTHSIFTTCWNAFEHTDAITPEVIIEMLLEEFDKGAVYRSEQRIGKVVREVNYQKDMFDKVQSLYREVPDCVLSSKGSLMRYMSTYFKKQDMKKVYGHLLRAGYVEDKTPADKNK